MINKSITKNDNFHNFVSSSPKKKYIKNSNENPLILIPFVFHNHKFCIKYDFQEIVKIFREVSYYINFINNFFYNETIGF